MKQKQIVMMMFVLLGGAFLPWSVDADLLRMKDGRLLEGKYLGGTEYVVRFYTSDGMREYPVGEILTLSFMPATGPLPPRTPLPTPAPTPPPPRQEIGIPPDTRLSVRMTVHIDTLVSRSGDTFDTELESDLVVEGITVASKGTVITGEVLESEQAKTGSSLVIVLKTMRVRNQVVQLRTTSYAMWDRPRDGEDSATRNIRTLRLAAGATLEFKTTEAVTVKLF
jgi:hypothetical protein